MALQQTVDHRQVQQLIRHSAILTVTDKPEGRRLSESVGCGTHTTSRYRGFQAGGQGTLGGHLVVPDAISVAHLSGHKRQLATRLLIDLHQSDVLGSAYDLLLSLDESGAGAFTHGPVDA
jgi:hypothetical protein